MTEVSKQLSRIKSLGGILLLCLLFVAYAAAQNAGDYFPSHPGNTWRYQRFSLDTLQNPITGSKTVVSDSLAVTEQIRDTTAFVLLSGEKPPFDTTFVNVQGSTISEFVTGYPRITTMLPVDSLGLGFVWDYLNWYPYMNFASTPGVRDTILYIKNKTVTFQGHPLTLVIYVTTTKFSDTSITVPAGTYVTTPFQIALNVNIPKSQSPFGHYEAPLFKLVDTLFIAKNNWLVKEIQPSTYYPLNNDSSYQVATTQLPGFVRLLESASLTSVPVRETVPREFTLEQNFPNPFNPTTDLRFTIADLRFVTLKVFDVLGKEVATLVNDQLPAGSYDVTFDARSLSSGVYFYRLSAGGIVQTKKMILEK
jgi:hypothetical protein